ncbi:MAG: Tryptophan--tRNA ligase, partial [Bacteroidota bacterium]
KDPETDITFKLFNLLANQEEVDLMRKNYLAGGYGYGHAKQALYEVMLNKFADAREKFDYYMNNPQLIEQKLEEGEKKVEPIAQKTIQRVREVFKF